jgi:hypothetical protein
MPVYRFGMQHFENDIAGRMLRQGRALAAVAAATGEGLVPSHH